MTTEAQKRAVERYDKKNTIQIKLKLNKKTDADIIQLLDSCGNKQGFIKDLLRNFGILQER